MCSTVKRAAYLLLSKMRSWHFCWSRSVLGDYYAGGQQVAPIWTDAMSDDARGAWESAVAAADIVVLNELAYERHQEQLQDKRLILLTSDASATLSTCDAPAL